MFDNVSVVGLGKLGLGLAAVFADAGLKTIGVDVNPALVTLINSGKAPGFEAGLEDLIGKHKGNNLIATTQHADAIRQTDITFLLVATPSNSQGHFSNQYLESALQTLADCLAESDKPFHTFVVGSTITPGAIERVLIPLIEKYSRRRLNEGFGVGYNPEFVALGNVVRGFQAPDAVLIGQSSATVGAQIESIHHRICRNQPQVRHMSIANAEIAKVALNVFLTLKMTFGNTLANLCENIPGGDPDVIADAIGQDRRIAPTYLRGGLAFGGPCFPRDTKAFAALARQYRYEPLLIDAIDRINEQQDERLQQRVLDAVGRAGNDSVGVLGLAFKPGTSVITASPSVRLIETLLQRGIQVSACDPHAIEDTRKLLGNKVQFAVSPEECIAASAVCVIANPEPTYKAAVEAYRGTEPKTIVDCWRMIDPAAIAANVTLFALGRGPQASSGPVSVEPAKRRDEIKRANILGVGVHAVNMEMAVREVERWIDSREPNFVLAVPAHCIVECLRSEKLRAIYNRAGLVTPDGMPVAWITRLMGHPHVDRVYGPDLMLALCERSVVRGYRHFLYGGWPPDVVEKLATKLRARFPGIQIVGTYAPPFRPVTAQEDKEIIEMINATKPDIVWVGLGAAKEEYWTESHLRKVSAPALIGVGAAFDFHAGVKPQAPHWMMRSGLEWFFRVLTEPKRLGPRYIRDNPVFLWNILLQALGKKPPSIEAFQQTVGLSSD